MNIAVRAARRSLAPTAASLRFESTVRVEPSQTETLLDVGTRGIFNEEHDMLRGMARKFFNERVVPFHAKWEEQQQVSRQVWQEAGQAGLLSVTTPTEYGGAGADILSAAVIWEEQAYTGCLGPGFSIHSEIAVPYIINYGSEEQKKRYLPGACNGNTVVAIAMTEPGAGSDLQGIKTTAVRSGDDFIINGQKTFISNGQLADVVIVVARTNNASKAAHGISLFLVDCNTPGFAKGRNLKKLGLRAQDTSELFFDNVRVPASAVLGQVDRGFYQLMTELPQERLVIAALAVAHAEACYEWTRTYVKDRKAFGATLAKLQTVRFKLAELKTNIAVSRAFVDRCIQLHMSHKLDAQMASMAKYWCTDVENKVADECLQLHGGYGFMWEYPITRAFADARVQKIYGGANEIMKELISRSI
eukprot:m.228670 g.228670  ORF g.228670 m.228670 type:complete len:417 (+) comp17556_c0_seq1:125-1375(+)